MPELVQSTVTFTGLPTHAPFPVTPEPVTKTSSGNIAVTSNGSSVISLLPKLTESVYLPGSVGTKLKLQVPFLFLAKLIGTSTGPSIFACSLPAPAALRSTQKDTSSPTKHTFVSDI